MRQTDFLYDIQHFVDAKKWQQTFLYCIKHIYMHTIEMLVSKML